MNSIEKLTNFINKIKEDESNLQSLIDNQDQFEQSDWDEVTESYEDLPEIVSNQFIIRKEDLGKKTGINFIINMYNQDYPDSFYEQPYIKELLDMDEDEYNEIMGSYQSLLHYNNNWSNLFYCKQCYFEKDFILNNADHFIDNGKLQRYQIVPIEFYEKYIDDDRLEYIALYDQDIPVDFLKKHMRKHHNKFRITNIIHIEGLTEELFTEFLSYPELQDEESQNSLWLTVGAYNISEEFIRNNYDKINRRYEDIFIINGYRCPWDLIVQNGVDYDENLIEENIKFISFDYIFRKWSSLRCEMKQYSPTFIKKYWDNDKVEILDILSQKAISQMDDFVENLIENDEKFDFNTLNKAKYLSLKIVEKYILNLDLDYVCNYNKNITLDFFKNKILPLNKDIELSIGSYLCIDKVSEETLKYFIEEYYKKYDEEDIQYFFKYAKDIINYFPERYSENIKEQILNEKIPNLFSKSNMKTIASLCDNDVVYRHSLRHILDRIN